MISTFSHNLSSNLYSYCSHLFSLKQLRKICLLISSSLILTACSNISLDNVPNVTPNLRYLTISSPNNKVLLQAYNQFTKDGYFVITKHSTTEQLQQAVTAIKVYRSQLHTLHDKTSKPTLPNTTTDTKQTAITYYSTPQTQKLINEFKEKNPGVPSEKSFQVDSNLSSDEGIITANEFDDPTDVVVSDQDNLKDKTDSRYSNLNILSLPTESVAKKLPKITKLDQVHDITQCQNQLLTFSCVSKFLPNMQITSYNTVNKNLSLFTSGDYAQRAVLSNLTAVLSLPKLGSITLYNLNSDLQFTNTATQLGNTVKSQVFDKLNLENAISTLASRVEFILESQTYKLKHNRP